MSLLFVYIDDMYLAEALSFPSSGFSLPADWMNAVWDYGKFSTIGLMLSWVSLVCVKFSFLALFKKLVDRVRYMNTYWWIVAVFNGLISAYGLTVYVVACPYYYQFKYCKLTSECVFVQIDANYRNSYLL